MIRTVSDVEGYKYKAIHSDGSVTYYNSIQMTDRLCEIMSRCWDSLPESIKLEINKEEDIN